MGIFTKPIQIDEALASVMIQPDGRAQKQVAREQDALRRALASGEHLSVIAADRTGSAVFAVTDQRLLRFRDCALRQEVPLDQITYSGISKVAGYYVAKANPNIEIRCDSFEQANVFMLSIDRRNIPTLYPEFFRRILSAMGFSETPQNMARLNERVAMAIGVAGVSYFMQFGDQLARKRFEERFDNGGPSERIAHVCDDMIDWLWEWRATCHGALRELIPSIERAMVGEDSPIKSTDGNVPPLAGSGFPSVSR